MTLSQRTPMRPCGRRFGSEAEALASKRGQSGSYQAAQCRDSRCGGVHLIRIRATAGVTAKPPADTGPDRKTRAAVLIRDGYACVRCGQPCGPGIGSYSLQHRVARGVGGGNGMSNLILLCGSATTGCHAVAEARHRDDNAAGWWLESWQDPRAEGVLYACRDGGICRWLDDEGSLLDEPAVAA
jgi:5-methylcytosine-specific restriction endonuclease McrA